MIIGITGRGGSGKSTIARYLCSKNPTYKYIEVDNLVEKKVFKSKRLLEKVNKYYKDKKYDINDIVSCYFKADEKSKIIHSFFMEEVNDIIREELIKRKGGNIIVDWFLLHKLSIFDEMDVKVLVKLDKKKRIERASSRNDSESIKKFLEVDKYYDDIYKGKYNYIIYNDDFDFKIFDKIIKSGDEV